MQLRFRSTSARASSGAATAGRGCLTLFFAFFLLIGAAATVALAVQAFHEAEVWGWPEHPCTIVAATVEETGQASSPYRPSVRFVYEIDGVRYESDRLTLASVDTASYDRAREPSDRYLVGSEATCRVDPENPAEAVLEARFPWIGLVSLLPLLFVAVGAGGMYLVWRRSGRSTVETVSISQRAAGRSTGHRIGLVIGIVFTIVGGGLSIFLVIVPLTRVAMALDWVETPAVVISSTVRSWSSDDGTSYRTDIVYEYHAGGRSWRSNRLRFFPGSSGDLADHREMVDRYPEGASTTCWVDPDDPSRSVLDRRPGLVFLIGLLPLVFLLAGVAVTLHSLRSGRERRPIETAGTASPQQAQGGDAIGSGELRPDAGPWAKVAGITIFAAIWNGIVGIFVWQVVEGFRRGDPEWFLTVFMIPFVLVGLALIGGIVYTTLAAFNPRPTLTVSPLAPRLGDELHVEWSFSGRVARIRRLEITLEGHEKASYRRGTDTHTDRQVFASMPLFVGDNPWVIGRGNAAATIPEDTMHSWSSANNAIVWSIVVHGDIPRWPDVMETFEIEVRPLSRERLLP